MFVSPVLFVTKFTCFYIIFIFNVNIIIGIAFKVANT